MSPAPPPSSTRRRFLATSLGTALLGTGCQPAPRSDAISGGFTGINQALGHLLQSPKTWPTPGVTRAAPGC
ncbi:MAG: hypothetical protein IPN53_00030 [Comamonadaceae bacterium]|nr:hypothetical protein [Comamonadaceae bacterium]